MSRAFFLLKLKPLIAAWELPVLGREFRSRMRGARTYWIIGVYVLAVMLCVLQAYGSLAGQYAGGANNRVAAELGRAVWTWGCAIQALLLPLVVPAFTCGGITLERERDMLELLLLTRQSALQICLGKLGSGVGLGQVLLLASVPVLSLSFFLGGVSPEEAAASLVVLMTAILLAGALGLAVSSLVARTVTATVVVYLLAGSALLGLPVMLALLGLAVRAEEGPTETGILLMGALLTAIAFPPAVGLAFLLHHFRVRRTGELAPRVWWIAAVGLSWCALMGALWIPGASEVLLQGAALLVMHPVVAVLGVLSSDPGAASVQYSIGPAVGPASGRVVGAAGPTPWWQSVGLPSVWDLAGGLTPHLWWVCALVYTGLASWLFLIAVLRVRRLRMGG